MKRKIFLLATTFVLLLLAFATYTLFNPSGAVWNPPGGVREMPAYLKIQPGDGPRPGPAADIVFYDRTKDGELRGIFQVQDWIPQDDGSYLLINPRLEARQSNDTRVYLSAKRGRVWGEALDRQNYNISRGRLEGDVEIYIDQNRHLDRKHPTERTYAKRLRETIRIHADDLDFSQDMLELKTPGQVTVTSARIDMVGEGLTIRWNEKPRELRELRLDRGDILKVKGLSKQMDLVQLPTRKKKPKAAVEPVVGPALPATSAPAVGPTRPADVVANAPASAPASEKALRDAWALNTTTASASAPDNDSSSVTIATASQPVKIVEMPDADMPARNVFAATFKTKVRIFSGNRTRWMRGADFLRLKFDWDLEARVDDEEDEDKSPAPTPVPGETTEGEIDGSASSAPATRGSVASSKEEKQDEDTLEIYWNGPLVIQTVGYTPEPDPDRYQIDGRGERVMLVDPQARIICSEFDVQNPQQEARFRGTSTSPTRLFLARGEEIVCQGQLSFNRSKGLGLAQGAGTAKRFAEDPQDWEMDALTPEEAQAKTITEKGTWRKEAQVYFEEVRRVDEKGREKTVPFFKKVVLLDGAEVVQMPRRDQTGHQVGQNFIAGKQLEIQMALDTVGRPYFSLGRAQGNVSGYWDGSEFSSQEATVYLRPKPKEKQSDTAKDTAKKDEKKSGDLMGQLAGGRTEPYRIIASGQLRLKYVNPDDPKEKPIHVQAETANVLLNYRGGGNEKSNQLAVLTGKPARIWQGTNRIEGPTIQFDEQNEAARVIGAGRIDFFTKQDLSGNQLKKARPIEIVWSKSMLYHGTGGYTMLDGDVDLDSAAEKLQTQHMRVFFQRKPNAKAAEKKKTDKRNIGLSVGQFSGMDIKQIIAVGGKGTTPLALMRSAAFNTTNEDWLDRRMELRGEKVVYDALSGITQVTGRGSFLAEDYRRPEEKKGDAAMSLDRPSQVLFKWKTSMTLDQKKRHVALRDQVVMAYYGGTMLRPVPGLKHEPWGKVKSGRIAAMNSAQMDAWFAEPKGKKTQTPAKTPTLEGGPQFGELTKFLAVKDVSFSEEASNNMRRIIDAQRILYEASTQLISAWGYLENAAKKTDARITIENTRTGLQQTHESPTLIYDIKNEKLKIGRIHGSGGGL